MSNNPMIQPCPNGGKCGARTHDVTKNQFRECKRLASSGIRSMAGASAAPPPPSAPHAFDAAAFDESMAQVRKRLASAETDAQEAIRRRFVGHVDAQIVVAETVCRRIERLDWEPDGDNDEMTLALTCGCSGEGVDARRFLDEHDVSSNIALGVLESSREWREFPTFSGSSPVSAVDDEEDDYEQVWRWDGMGNHMEAFGLGADNDGARAFLRDYEWWDLNSESPEVALAKTLHPGS